MASLQQAVSRLGRFWAKRLKLIPRWDLEFLVVDKVDRAGSFGSCRWRPDAHEATIKIQRDVAANFPCSLEETIIHELGHIVWEGHRQYRGRNLHQERTLNTFAEALVAAYRGNKKK